MRRHQPGFHPGPVSPCAVQVATCVESAWLQRVQLEYERERERERESERESVKCVRVCEEAPGFRFRHWPRKLEYDKLLSSYGINFDLRRYTAGLLSRGT